MSIVTLKKKVKTQYDNMSVNSKHGFSLNGTTRSQGFIGQTSLSRSLSRTLCKGAVPKGHGGCCGTFPVKHIIQSGVNYLNDPTVVKQSVMNTKAMIETQYNCVPPRICNYNSTSGTTSTENVLKKYVSSDLIWSMGNICYSNTMGVSNNGTNIYAIAYQQSNLGLGRFLFVSNDNGNTFRRVSNVLTTDVQDGVKGICCDETGQYVYICQTGNLYKSNNFGLNFTSISSGSKSVSCSTNGQYVVYVKNDSTIYYSNNYGANFSNLSGTNYQSVAISPDGTKILATITNSSIKYTSNAGSTWSTISNPSSNLNFGNISIANDSTILLTTYTIGSVYVYRNSAWTQASSLPTGNYYNSSISNDGKVMVVCDNNGQKVYYSINYGIDWYYLSDISIYNNTSPSISVSRDGKYICFGNGSYTDLQKNFMSIYLLGNKQATNLMFSKGKYNNIVKPDLNHHMNNQQDYIDHLVNQANSCPQIKNKNIQQKCPTKCPLYFKTNYRNKYHLLLADPTKTKYMSQDDYITNVKSVTCIKNDVLNIAKKNLGTPFSCSHVK